MPHHVGCLLPDGRHVVADHKDPVVKPMQRILKARQDGKPASLADYAEVERWADGGNGCSFLCEDLHEDAAQDRG